MDGIVPQQSQVLIKTEINNSIWIIGKDLLDSKIYSLIKSFRLLSLFRPTKENKITLITCVENKPELRRCIQGILKIWKEKFV